MPFGSLLVGPDGRVLVEDRNTVVVTGVFEQGHAMGRPRLLRVEVEGNRVRLGGAGVVLAAGSLRV